VRVSVKPQSRVAPTWFLGLRLLGSASRGTEATRGGSTAPRFWVPRYAGPCKRAPIAVRR
jgi:hypothetical protein